MHPLHDYVAKQLGDHLKERRFVVFYDPRGEFTSFIGELRGGPGAPSVPAPISAAGVAAKLVTYDGSFFELRAAVEPFVSGDEPEPVVLYLPGVERDRKGSVLMELEKAGTSWEPALRQLARNVLLKKYTQGVVDELVPYERPVTYEDLARAASDTTSPEPPSILRSIFHDAPGNDGLLAAWLVRSSRDAEIESKLAVPELVKLVRSRLGLELPGDGGLQKMRSVAMRYVLAGEFRSDLRCPPPPSLDGTPTPRSKGEEEAVRALALRLRASFPDDYASLADAVEKGLGLRDAGIPAEALGSVDTFRFEERALLTHCGALIAGKRFEDALALVGEREQSFWLDRDLERKAQWEACRRMATLGATSVAVRAAVARVGPAPDDWVDAYTSKEGWYRLDQAQRRLEAWVTNLDDPPEEKPLGVVRGLYEEVCRIMAEGFTKALVQGHWTVPKALHQTRIYSEIIAERPKPVAYFFVDAMRFEMGLDLVDRLPKAAEISVRPAIAALPSITTVGMAALLPGASGSFTVVEEKKDLGARIDDTFLPGLPARKKLAAARVPNLADLTLNDLLSLPASTLAKRLDGAQVVVVRSTEIDKIGEGGIYQARQVMDTVIDNLARAIRKLAGAGVEHSVVTADHGHLFFAEGRDDSMKTDGPGGDQIELHRRCWIGRGGSTPPGCIRVPASELGYASDLELVFPSGSGIFKAGGDLAFHHGGPSLQEMVIPVLSVRLKVRESLRPTDNAVTATGLPDAVTNRIFSISLQLGGQTPSLFSSPTLVRPMLMAAGRQVGKAEMAVDAELDLKTGCVKLQPGKPTTVAFMLKDDSIASLRVVVQDPTNDADLYRSPSDIPVRL